MGTAHKEDDHDCCTAALRNTTLGRGTSLQGLQHDGRNHGLAAEALLAVQYDERQAMHDADSRLGLVPAVEEIHVGVAPILEVLPQPQILERMRQTESIVVGELLFEKAGEFGRACFGHDETVISLLIARIVRREVRAHAIRSPRTLQLERLSSTQY